MVNPPLPTTDVDVKNENKWIYIQLGMTTIAIVFFTCAMVFGYVSNEAAMIIIVALINQWIRSPIDVGAANISRAKTQQLLVQSQARVMAAESVAAEVKDGTHSS